MNNEEKEALAWLSALDVRSEYEASSKEIILSLIEKQEKVIKVLKEDIKQFGNYEERKQMDAKQLFENDGKWFYAKYILSLLEDQYEQM